MSTARDSGGERRVIANIVMTLDGTGYWPAVADMPDADSRDQQFAQWLNDVDKVVFSTTLDRTDWTNSRIACTEPADVVRELRNSGGSDIRVLSSQSVMHS